MEHFWVGVSGRKTGLRNASWVSRGENRVLVGLACLLENALLHGSESIVTKHNLRILPCRGIQPMAHGLHVAQDGYKCGSLQNHKFS